MGHYGTTSVQEIRYELGTKMIDLILNVWELAGDVVMIDGPFGRILKLGRSLERLPIDHYGFRQGFLDGLGPYDTKWSLTEWREGSEA